MKRSTIAMVMLAVGVAARAEAAPPAPMASIPAGAYRPFVPVSPDKSSVIVPAFRIDRVPVTNGDYLQFVRQHREWSRDRIASTFAESSYLGQWEGADSLGADAEADRPVVYVSWFAARAYCVSQGKRLPTEAEWERVAAASRTAADGAGDASWRAELLALYSRPAPTVLPRAGAGAPNFWGVSDLHGVVWEWVNDFNNIAASTSSGSDKLRFCGATAGATRDITDFAAFERLALRSSLRASFVLKNLGFRCAADGVQKGKS